MRKWRNWKLLADYRKCIQKMMDQKQVMTEEVRNQESDRFVRDQAAIVLIAGALFLLVLAASLAAGFHKPESITLKREGFGRGSREIPLILEQDGKEKEYLLNLGEQDISKEEVEDIFKAFFKKLERSMAGENQSLTQVRKPLYFPERLSGFPFSLSYQPEDSNIINLNGTIGKKGRGLEMGSLSTQISVTAAYGNLRETKTFPVIVLSPETERKTDLEKAADVLTKQEKDSRSLAEFTFPSSLGGVRVRRPGHGGIPSGWIALFLIVAVLPFFRHYSLKNKVMERQKETEADFSIIVHLFALFMSAGLSFPSSVTRISQAYREGRIVPERRVAFDRILVMENRMHDGVSSKEALREWAGTYSFAGYRKLALILTQCMTKGQKEAMIMMEKEEGQAFTDRIDKARTEGEEARTRLLFPMIVLLAATMILIMFPALMNFYRF